MFSYSKLAQAGIAAMSYLAEISAQNRLAGSTEIAERRDLSRALVAKILTVLSAAHLVDGKPGPSGGYKLARPASAISLRDVVLVFEDPEERVMCPFGPNWCGVGANCPLHNTFIAMHDETLSRLAGENFAQFVKPP
jgi:Rrf2 family transcriptional regulator, iron-sulfur cluster assembly transcription factor